jgi:hypothetical protein
MDRFNAALSVPIGGDKGDPKFNGMAVPWIPGDHAEVDGPPRRDPGNPGLRRDHLLLRRNRR